MASVVRPAVTLLECVLVELCVGQVNDGTYIPRSSRASRSSRAFSHSPWFSRTKNASSSAMVLKCFLTRRIRTGGGPNVDCANNLLARQSLNTNMG